MKKVIMMCAAMVLLAAPALADLEEPYFTAIGDPVEGNSWSQRFATRAGDWGKFDKITIWLASGDSFESPALTNFQLAKAASNAPQTPYYALPDWTLTLDTSTLATAEGSAIGGKPAQKGYWLLFDAHFVGNAPDPTVPPPPGSDGLKFTAIVYYQGTATWWYDITYNQANLPGNLWDVEHHPCSEPPPPPVIPAPAAVVLGLIGLGTLGVWRRRYS